jgi:AcrR family transcriptional regulator
MPGYVRADARREQLLAAAREVLIRDGLADLTLRGVAQEAGVRLSTLQYIFPTRTDLLAALSSRVLSDVGFGTFPPGDEDLPTELHASVEAMARHLGDPAFTELVRQEYLASVARGGADGRLEIPWGRAILAEILAGRLQAILRRPGHEPVLDEGTQMLWVAAILGLTYEFLRTGELESFRSGAHAVADQVVRLSSGA